MVVVQTVSLKAIQDNANRVATEFKGVWINGPMTLELLPALPRVCSNTFCVPTAKLFHALSDYPIRFACDS
jgi:hypothetical protein